MKVLSAAFAKENKDFIVSEMKAGKIFIYPTDTVYGIGCDSTNDTAVAKIHEIKRRENKPLLVIIPNINWIEEHCAFHDAHRKELEEKLPGPYSFIVTLQDKDAVSEGILQGRDTLGVRIPDCYFSEFVADFGVPFVSTSVNFSGESPATAIDTISEDILNHVDYVLEADSELLGKPSTIIDVTGEEMKELR